MILLQFSAPGSTVKMQCPHVTDYRTWRHATKAEMDSGRWPTPSYVWTGRSENYSAT